MRLVLVTMMLSELRKRRTARDAGLADAPEPPQIDRGGRREKSVTSKGSASSLLVQIAFDSLFVKS